MPGPNPQKPAVRSDGDVSQLPEDVVRAVNLALERKAHSVVVLDLRGINTATDYCRVCSGTSDIQVRAIADHVMKEMKGEQVRPGHVEGLEGGRWVLLDYIDFVVHVFHPSARDFY